MNRYQIALRKTAKEGIVRFPATTSIVTTMKYILYCRHHSAILMANEIPSPILEIAIVKISKKFNLPIYVKTIQQARILSTAHSCNSIYSLDLTTPGDQFEALCYDCSAPCTVMHPIIIKTLPY